MPRRKEPNPRKNIKKAFARPKKAVMKASVSKKRTKDLSLREKLILYISQGIKLNIPLLWMVGAAVILFIFILLILFRPEKPKIMSSEQITRLAPTIKHIQVSPTEAYSNDTLFVNVRCENGEQGKIFFRYLWYKNDLRIEGANGNQLSNVYFKKGDIIRVTVTPVMNAIEGKPVTSRHVRIKNNPPVMQPLIINPKVVYADTNIVVQAEAEDQEKDFITFRYQWIKNGSIIQAQESNSLSQKYFVKNDQIQVEVTPFDGDDYGRSVISAPIFVNNTPPVIDSLPPESLEKNGAFIYQVHARDIDNDPLTYSLSSNNPEGVTMEAENGLLTWKIPEDIEFGTYKIEVSVYDNEGDGGTQSFDIEIQPY